MPTLTLKEEGKPTIFLWGDYSEKSHVNRNKVEEHALKLYDNLFSQIYAIVEAKKLTSASLPVFKACFEHKLKLMWETSGKWLMQFTHYFEEFKELTYDLMKSDNATVRLHVVQSLWDYMPAKDVIDFVLVTGLNDDSKKVRYFTIERIQLFNKRSMIDALNERLVIEKDKENHKLIENTLSLFKVGYWTEDFSENETYVNYRSGDSMISFLISKENLTVEKVLSEIDKRELG